MKNALYALALTLLVAGSAAAQEVTKKEAVKTTKIAQDKAKTLQAEAKKSGSKTEKKDADKTMDAAKRAENKRRRTRSNPVFLPEIPSIDVGQCAGFLMVSLLRCFPNHPLNSTTRW